MNTHNTDKEDLEPIIKDLLYEASAREKLTSKKANRFSKNLLYTITSIAAVFLLLIAAFQIVPSLSSTNYNEIIAQHYEFPAVNKSRSNNPAVIDQYLPSLKSKNYKEVLSEIRKQEARGIKLSEQDQFIKAHLLFSTDLIDEAKLLIENQNWQDEYIIEELSWLSFLIDFKKKASKANLLEQQKLLPLKYKDKAASMLAEIKK